MAIPVPRPRRSVLYLPGSNARAIEKARTLDCDSIIFDLEDAVAPEMKPAARQLVSEALAAGGFGQRELVVRINALTTDWGHEDLSTFAQSAADVLLLSKVASAEDLQAVDAALDRAAPKLALWAMIETCAAMLNLPEIAACAANTRLAGFVMGLEDLATEMRISRPPGRLPLIPVLTNAVLAARAHGLVVLDGVWTALEDSEGLAAECEQGLAFGFDGKTLIHPNQIETANRVFSPSDAAIARCRAIVAAFEDPANAGKGAIRLEGRMVEPLHLMEARRLLASLPSS